MKKRSLSFLFLLFISACTRTVWHHPEGYGEEALRKDMFTCRVISREAAMQSHTAKERLDREKYEEVFERCMDARGWRKEEVFSLF